MGTGRRVKMRSVREALTSLHSIGASVARTDSLWATAEPQPPVDGKLTHSWSYDNRVALASPGPALGGSRSSITPRGGRVTAARGPSRAWRPATSATTRRMPRRSPAGSGSVARSGRTPRESPSCR